MSALFTCTRSGTNSNYMRYLWGNPIKMDKKQEAATLDFALAPADSSFVKLVRGDYIDLYSVTYGHWFTGYVTIDPEVEYLGKKDGVGHWGYKYQATADEYILSLKQMGLQRPFMNVSMGFILRTMVERLCPGLFNTTNIQDGPIIAQYTIDPSKKFIDLSKELCEAANFVFYGKSHSLYFMPQDDVSFPSITLNGSNKHFTPSRLSISPSKLPIINDAIVVGDVEPQKYMQEYFLGTGLQGTFPLKEAVFGAEKTVLLKEDFSGSEIDLNQWEVDDPGDTLAVSSGYLNIAGAGTYIRSYNGIPLEGYLRLTHGEWDFISGSGVIAALYTGDPSSGISSCVYGIDYNGSQLSPIVNGAIDAEQTAISINTAKRYILRTIAEFSDFHRSPQPYSFIDSTGVVTSVYSQPKECKVKWHTIVTEVDPANGEVTAQSTFTNEASLDSSTLYANYVPFVASSLHGTLSGITLSVPVNAVLEIATKATFRNQSFDEWDSFWVPKGWDTYQSVVQEDTWYDDAGLTTTQNACRMYTNPLYPSDKIYISQNAATLLQPFTPYDISIRVRKNPTLESGTFKAYLQYLDKGSQSTEPDSSLLVPFFFDRYNVTQDKIIQLTAIEQDVTGIPDSYITLEGRLTDGLSSIPNDIVLVLELTTGQTTYGAMWVDNMEITTPFIPKLLGPNEIDAMDGLTPYATITSANTGRAARDPLLGGNQYYTGQSQLVFFKDSVHRVSNTPTENQIVRLSYRSAGTAVGRVISQSSVTEEASAWGDDGYRSVIRKDLVPRPRSSYECELAAYAIVSQNSYQHYEGSYKQYSTYFDSEPRAGCIIRFVNLDNMIPDLQAEEVTSVRTVFECEKGSADLFYHDISFAVSKGTLEKLLTSIGTAKEFQKESSSSINPQPIDLAEVGVNYAEQITQPRLISWTPTRLTFSVGNVNGTAEIRSSDRAWGEGDGKNTITTSSNTFEVPVTQRNSIVYMKVVE